MASMLLSSARRVLPATNMSAQAAAATPATNEAGRHLAPNGVIIVTNVELLTLGFSVLFVLVVSNRLELQIDKQLTVGAVRCLVQLTALGLVLVPILTYNYPPLVLGYIIVMMFVAAVEAAARPPYVFDSLVLVCFMSITMAVGLFGTFTFYVVIRTGLDAQYVIPITGMITGSAMSAVSVAVSNIVTEFAERRHNMEVLLALGGNRWEASIDIIRASIKLGLTPTLNQLSVTGLVAIPGMMTGQIIGGTPPSLAAKYQLVIMYVNAGTATIATLAASLLTINALIDSEYRIRAEKLSPRDQVNRVESLIKTYRYVSSRWVQWREQVNQRQSPFPSYVNEPLPETSTSALMTEPPSKPGNTAAGYAAVSSSQTNEEDN